MAGQRPGNELLILLSPTPEAGLKDRGRPYGNKQQQQQDYSCPY
jgi:hypothetical protein